MNLLMYFIIFMPVILPLCVFGFMTLKHKDLMKVDFGAISKFLSFVALVVCTKISMAEFQYDVLGYGFGGGYTDSVATWDLLFVFTEDLLFVVPIFIFIRYISNKLYWTIPFVLLIMFAFASGHLYQGLLPAAIIGLYPIVAYKFSLKYGFGTVMACHVLYDYIIIYLHKALPYLIQ